VSIWTGWLWWRNRLGRPSRSRRTDARNSPQAGLYLIDLLPISVALNHSVDESIGLASRRHERRPGRRCGGKFHARPAAVVLDYTTHLVKAQVCFHRLRCVKHFTIAG
jgi:hypothetical protein